MGNTKAPQVLEDGREGMKLKTMLYAALGALTFKAGKLVAKRKTGEAVEDFKSRRNARDSSPRLRPRSSLKRQPQDDRSLAHAETTVATTLVAPIFASSPEH
jgi:hypothetical protein